MGGRPHLVAAAQVEIETIVLNRFIHSLVSSAETRHAFNSDFDTINLHRHTSCAVMMQMVGAARRITAHQGLTLLHFSAQPEPFLVTKATASVHFSAQPETLLPMRPLNIAHKKCSRQAEKWTSVVHEKCLR